MVLRFLHCHEARHRNLRILLDTVSIEPLTDIVPSRHDPRLVWPDTMSLADDGFLYVTSNQLNRQPTMHNGIDERVKPYVLFRLQTSQKPVRLQ